MTVQLAAPRTSLSFASAIRTVRSSSAIQGDDAGRGTVGQVSAPQAQAAAQVRPAPLRLTRRGRLLLVGAPIMLGGAALLISIGFFTAPALAAAGNGELTRTQQVSVSTGESLWGLATEYAPERDPRDVVADIMELNNLTDAVVPAGAQLYIPVAG